MNPELVLGIVSAFAAFLLKTTLAFGVCVVLGWLVDSPNRRFILWLLFLTGAAGYWVWTIFGFLPVMPSPAHSFTAIAPAARAQHNAIHMGAGVTAWQIPDAWSLPLGVAVRALAIIYVLILSYLLANHMRKQRHLTWVLSFTTEPSAEILNIFQPLARNLHAGRARLLVLSGISSPATFGCIRPTIVVPAECLEQNLSELENILRHELHHIRRFDFAWNTFAMVCRSVLFFHPAAWYALRTMQYDRELACDLAVVSGFPERKAGYAECLLRFARLNLVNDSKSWGIDFAASTEQLKARVQSVLAESKKTPLTLLALRTACGLALFAASLDVAPSLAVLLSFAPRQATQPLAPQAISITTHKVETRPTKQLRLHARPVTSLASGTTSAYTEPQPVDHITLDPLNETAGASPLPAGPGPKLMHRPASATQSSTKSHPPIVFDDGGQTVRKKGDPGPADALQQTATVVTALYKKLDNLKPEK